MTDETNGMLSLWPPVLFRHGLGTSTTNRKSQQIVYKSDKLPVLIHTVTVVDVGDGPVGIDALIITSSPPSK